jgi:hypothetical protein
MEFEPEIRAQFFIFAPFILGLEVAERSNFYLYGLTKGAFWSLSQHLDVLRK